MSDFEIKKMVLVNGTSRMPCASIPSSFANEVVQVSRYFSILARSRYYKDFPVSSSMIAFAKYLSQAHSSSCICMLAPTSTLAPLLLIFKAGMSAVSFYARNVIRSLLGFLFCSLTLWLILVL